MINVVANTTMSTPTRTVLRTRVVVTVRTVGLQPASENADRFANSSVANSVISFRPAVVVKAVLLSDTTK